MKCLYCKNVVSNPTYNQKYYSNECREKKYDDDKIIIKRLNGCEICGFWRFTESHHIIKQMDFGSNNKNNLIQLCPNHHKMADSCRYGDEFLKLLKKKTGKCGERLRKHEIERVKNFIFDKLKGTLCGEDRNENDFLFFSIMRELIMWGELYDIALKDKQTKIKQRGDKFLDND